jgi:hypothetical protein
LASPRRRQLCWPSTPDEEQVQKARRSLPAELAQRVSYKVASGEQIELKPLSFDLVVVSWSL